MAKIVEQTITITVSKLVKSSHDADTPLTEEQLVTLVGSLPDLVEQLIDDDSAVVEVNLE